MTYGLARQLQPGDSVMVWMGANAIAEGEVIFYDPASGALEFTNVDFDGTPHPTTWFIDEPLAFIDGTYFVTLNEEDPRNFEED